MTNTLTAASLSEIVTNRSENGREVLQKEYAGVEGLCKALGSDPRKGLASTADFDQYRTKYGRNYVAPARLASYLELLWEASKDFTIFVLCLAAIASIVFALILEHSLTDGAGILIAVVLVTNVAAVNDWQKQKQFARLNAIVADIKVVVMRSGVKVETVSTQIVVGDVITLSTGDILCADALYITGADVTTDESCLTGESDLLPKSADDPFLLSGTKVMAGSCKALIVAVGENSESGRIAKLVSESDESESSVLKQKLERMVMSISKAGTTIAVICFSVMMIHFCIVSYAVDRPDFECANLGYRNCAGPFIASSGTLCSAGETAHVFTNTSRTASDCASQSERQVGCSLEFEFDSATGRCSCLTALTCTASASATTMRYSTSGCRTIMGSKDECTEHDDIAGCEWVNERCVNPITIWCDDSEPAADCSIVTGWPTTGTNGRCVSLSSPDQDHNISGLVIGSPCGWFSQHVGTFLGFFIIAVTILVVAIPEGLPLATTLSLAFSVIKMQKDNNLVKHLDACETMGSATRICSDKTGTLTQNVMTVVRIYLGATDSLSDVTPAPDKEISVSNAPKESLDLLCSSFCAFGSGEVNYDPNGGKPKILGNVTECALLKAGDSLGYDHKKIRPTHNIVKLNVFSSERKRASVIVEREGGYRIFVQGASEIIVDLCSHCDKGGSSESMTDANRDNIRKNVIEVLNDQAMRTISTSYKDVDSSFAIDDVDLCERDLIFLGIMGIEDPIRPEVPHAIAQCTSAHISVVMVTGDNIATATAIAKQCGILRPGIDLDKDGKVKPFAAMTGPDFRREVLDGDTINFAKFDEIWPHLRVLARSSPSDKYTLVKGLNESEFYKKDCGKTVSSDRQVVAVTGDGTNDAPALKRADVGFAMGIAGTNVAKDAADVIVLDDNFKSIVAAVKWGRNVYDSCTKFLQFQLTVNVVACILATIGAVAIADSPLKAVQMLWVNVIMDSLGALALATESPTDSQLLRPPYGRNQTIITTYMKWNVYGHSLYQLVVLCVILFLGPELFDIESGVGKPHGSPPTIHFTLVFNVLVCMTLCNEFNSRKLFHERNVFSNIMSNVYFFEVQAIQVIGQVLLIEFGGRWTDTAPLPLWAWLVSIGLGVSTILVQQVIITVARLCKSGPQVYSAKVSPNEEV